MYGFAVWEVLTNTCLSWLYHGAVCSIASFPTLHMCRIPQSQFSPPSAVPLHPPPAGRPAQHLCGRQPRTQRRWPGHHRQCVGAGQQQHLRAEHGLRRLGRSDRGTFSWLRHRTFQSRGPCSALARPGITQHYSPPAHPKHAFETSPHGKPSPIQSLTSHLFPTKPYQPAQAVGANELQLTASTLVLNTASDTGGALDAAACALVVINASRVDNNTAPSGGGAHLWNANEAYGTAYDKGQAVGGSIAIVAKSSFNHNAAVRTLVPADATTGQDAVLTVRQQGGPVRVRSV